MLINRRRRFFPDLTFIAAISAPDRLFTSCLEDIFAIFDTDSLKKTSFKVEKSSRCVALDYVRTDSNNFMSCDADGTVRLWDLRQPKRLAGVSESGCSFLPREAAFNSAAISADARLVCTGSSSIEKNVKRKKCPKPSFSHKRPRCDGDIEYAKADAVVSDVDDDEDTDTSPAYLVCWDTRKFMRPLNLLGDIHSDNINFVTFEPYGNSPRLLSCADDGLVCFTDITAPEMDQLVEVFNAEKQVNYCGFLHRGLSSPTIGQSGVFSFSNMCSQFSAWPLTPSNADEDFETPPSWRKLASPESARLLLNAAAVAPSTDQSVAICLVSTSSLKGDIRVSLITPDHSALRAKRRLLKRTTEAVDNDAFYAEFLSFPGFVEAKFHLIVVGQHSVNNMEATL